MGPRFDELTLREFIDKLSSDEPVPGGGSASAVAASLGAGLVAMVAALSANRPRYAAHAALHARVSPAGRELAHRLLQLASDDAAAYAAYGEARKLPKEASAEAAPRARAIAEAARRAAEVPLAVVEACLELVSLAESLAGRSNANASSDLNVAAILGEAAARGAAENVLVNLPSVGDEAYAGETTARVVGLLNDVERLASATSEAVQSGDARDPLPR
jgi:formiminotetrahydrofolate cyclodeaminase